MAAAIRQVRLHLEQRDGLLRKAAKLIFGSDGSLYLVPYANRGEFYYGGRTFAAGQTDDPFNFREQIQADSQPKLSIHATGDVHIYANDQPKAGPVQIPPLADLLGDDVTPKGVNVIAGFDPLAGRDDPVEYLYLRGL